MPSRHSKQVSDRPVFTQSEKAKSGTGTLTVRLGTESQLPFGYCGLSLKPAEEAVISPSGHIYSREAILEYLLTKTKEIKDLARAHEIQQIKRTTEEHAKIHEEEMKSIEKFSETQSIDSILKRKASDILSESEYMQSRKKVFDDTDKEAGIVALARVSPWLPQSTPSHTESSIKEPPKRPLSPFSGQPLRAKDLIPIDLVRESTDEEVASMSGPVRYICPVARKTITNQKVILLRNTGAYMLESTAETLAYPTMTCPSTGKKFKQSDIITLQAAASGFSASGPVEASRYGSSMT